MGSGLQLSTDVHHRARSRRDRVRCRVIGYYEGEIDSDGDGVPDYFDDFPYDPAASRDTDGDGMPDDWNDGATEQEIADSPLTVDDDDDNDGIPDADDPNPLVPDDGLAFLADFSDPFNGAVVEAPFIGAK